MDNLMKCPYCGKMIHQTAKKCCYCGEWLPEEQEKVKNPTSSDLQEEIPSIQSLVDSNKPASVSAVQSAMPKQVSSSLKEQTSYLSFGQAISTCFKKYAKFSGRASRSEYWWWVLFVNLLPLPFLLMYYIPIFIYMQDGYSYFDAAMLCIIENDGSFNVVFWLYILMLLMLMITCLPSLAVAVRRLHDVGESGWNLLFSLIPIFGPLYLLLSLAGKSKEESPCTPQDSSQEKPTE